MTQRKKRARGKERQKNSERSDEIKTDSTPENLQEERVRGHKRGGT